MRRWRAADRMPTGVESAEETAGRPVGRAAHVVRPSEEDAERFLELAVHGLEQASPEESARHLLSSRGARTLLIFAAVNVVAIALWPVQVFIAWIALITAVYVFSVLERVVLYRRSLDA